MNFHHIRLRSLIIKYTQLNNSIHLSLVMNTTWEFILTCSLYTTQHYVTWLFLCTYYCLLVVECPWTCLEPFPIHIHADMAPSGQKLSKDGPCCLTVINILTVSWLSEFLTSLLIKFMAENLSHIDGLTTINAKSLWMCFRVVVFSSVLCISPLNCTL